MDVQGESIRLGTAALDRYCHVCIFYRTLDEQYQVLLPFIKEGIKSGDRAVCVVDPDYRSEFLRRLSDAEVAREPLKRDDQLEVLGWDETFLLEGHFKPDRMLAWIEETLHRKRSEGFAKTRLIGQMDWPLADRSGTYDILECEARLNWIVDKYRDPVICAYDVTKCDAGTILDALRTHPLVVIGGTVHENPYFMPPEQFLCELSLRRSSQVVR